MQFDDSKPIYLQLYDYMVERIIAGDFPQDQSVPSVRQLSSEFRINHLTANKAIQLLVDEGALEKRRGIGMFVTLGASERLKQQQRQRFVSEDWPKIVKKINQLNIPTQPLIDSLTEKETKE